MARRHGALGTALAALLLLISGCASNPVRLDAARAPRAACPAAAPHLALPARSAGADLVPAGPVSAVVCQYGSRKVADMPRTVPLTGAAAAGLAAVLNSAGPLGPAERHCAQPGHRDPFEQ